MTLPNAHFQGTVLGKKEVSGFVLAELAYPSGLKVPKHCHEVANFCIALQGSCNETLGKKSRDYKPRSMVFLPPEETHSLEFHASGLRCFTIEIAPIWLDRTRDYSLVLDRSVHVHGGILAHTLMKLYDEFRQMDEVSPLVIEGLTLELLARASRSQQNVQERTPPRWLEQAKEFLLAHFTEHLNLVTVSEAVGVHAVHLAREFRKHYHCTAGEYVRQLRIEYACSEMCRANLSLAEIALTAGFADQSHFSKVFKRFTGMTPAEYRATLSTR